MKTTGQLQETDRKRKMDRRNPRDQRQQEERPNGTGRQKLYICLAQAYPEHFTDKLETFSFPVNAIATCRKGPMLQPIICTRPFLIYPDSRRLPMNHTCNSVFVQKNPTLSSLSLLCLTTGSERYLPASWLSCQRRSCSAPPRAP